MQRVWRRERAVSVDGSRVERAGGGSGWSGFGHVRLPVAEDFPVLAFAVRRSDGNLLFSLSIVFHHDFIKSLSKPAPRCLSQRGPCAGRSKAGVLVSSGPGATLSATGASSPTALGTCTAIPDTLLPPPCGGQAPALSSVSLLLAPCGGRWSKLTGLGQGL